MSLAQLPKFVASICEEAATTETIDEVGIKTVAAGIWQCGASQRVVRELFNSTAVHANASTWKKFLPDASGADARKQDRAMSASVVVASLTDGCLRAAWHVKKRFPDIFSDASHDHGDVQMPACTLLMPHRRSEDTHPNSWNSPDRRNSKQNIRR